MDDRQKSLDEFFRNSQSSRRKKEKDSKEIDDYFNQVSQKKSKKTFADKLVEFFRMISFKNRFDENKVSVNKKRSELINSSKVRRRLHGIQNFFVRKFSFEAGVDILDDKSVLYRKNLVIQNIIVITNIVFLLFTLIGSEGLDSNINLIVTFVIALIMFVAGRSIGNIIKEKPTTIHKQQMGEYLSGIYVLMMAIAVYIKLRLTLGDSLEGGFFSITQAGYSLIYFSLVVIALYQDSKLLNVVFKVTIVAMTIIHVVVMYPIYNHANDFAELWGYINGPILTDIVLRTLILAVFMIGLYSTVKISEDINVKRKQELVKRRKMEKDFKDVVADVFEVIAVYKQRGEDIAEKNYADSAKRVAKMAGELGGFLGYSSKLCQEIFEFSTIHIDKRDVLNVDEYDNKEQLNESDYKVIRNKTIIGSIIIKRLQLDKKAEDIVRAHFEKTVNKDFIKEMNGIQNNRESQVILLSHLYDILRQDRNYKKKLNHKRAIDLIKYEFNEYFDPQIVDRFLKYEAEFESTYHDLLEE
jgi:HD-GYP domain-containing protein (c-di-GMP phosphodiesterase class II)